MDMVEKMRRPHPNVPISDLLGQTTAPLITGSPVPQYHAEALSLLFEHEGPRLGTEPGHFVGTLQVPLPPDVECRNTGASATGRCTEASSWPPATTMAPQFGYLPCPGHGRGPCQDGALARLPHAANDLDTFRGGVRCRPGSPGNYVVLHAWFDMHLIPMATRNRPMAAGKKPLHMLSAIMSCIMCSLHVNANPNHYTHSRANGSGGEHGGKVLNPSPVGVEDAVEQLPLAPRLDKDKLDGEAVHFCRTGEPRCHRLLESRLKRPIRTSTGHRSIRPLRLRPG